MTICIFGFVFCVPFPALTLDRIERVIAHGHGDPLPDLSEDHEINECRAPK